jgi:hypothetical protein
MATKKVRKVGEVLLDMEPLIQELVAHELQWGDILNLIRGYLEVHCPLAQEEYIEGGHPVFYYGPGDDDA